MSKEKISDSVTVLIELLEVSIHCVLYARKIYPEGIFELKKKYNVPVHVSIYPKLNSYINGTLNAVKSLLKLKKLCKLDVCFYNKIGVVVERFVFNIRNVELELNLSDFSNLRDPYLIKLEQMLRAFCLKLTVCDSLLKPLPSSCTFQIHIHTTETTSIEIQKDTEIFKHHSGCAPLKCEYASQIEYNKNFRLKRLYTSNLRNQGVFMREISIEPIQGPFMSQEITTSGVVIFINSISMCLREFPLIPSEKKDTILTSPAIVPMRSIDCEHLNLEIYAEEGNKDEDPDLFTPSPLI